ncbi:MAG TPA: UDP-N-acetylmuramoyl-L-alanine--D-glutamate ligase, partial [Candidatus Omnitrophota bacterium]|nr:UDP-N-acetylmuramoyl-L-alanine--D-glutamate ligase [Candidatus Omnitrophota bacterium]
MFKTDLRNKRVTVVGLGNSGYNAANLLLDLGAQVLVTDSGGGDSTLAYAESLEQRGACVETGRHTEDFVKRSSLVVLSPGVEDSSSPVLWAVRHNIPIIGEMELGYRYCKGKIIAITGTNGKSTVTTLIGDMLKCGGKHTVVCGNIGNSLCGEIPRISEDSWVVLEVSSFQLERIEYFKPHIALILNITDDHMDRYKTFGEYFAAKEKVFKNQFSDDYLVLNYDAENLRPFKNLARSKVFFYSRMSPVNGAYLEGQDIICESSGMPVKVLSLSDISLKGVHNTENVTACVLASTLAGVRPDRIREAVRNFKGLHHRVEPVEVIDGIQYIDDSKGTTVDSTKRALESFEKGVILIAGGKD